MSTTTTCPCRRAVPLDYSTRDREQAHAVLAIIDQMGEWLDLNVAGRWYRVSRHCVALHGITAAEIESYGFALSERPQ